MAAYAGFMTYVTCRLTAKNLDQLRNPIARQSSMGYLYPLLLLACVVTLPCEIINVRKPAISDKLHGSVATF